MKNLLLAVAFCFFVYPIFSANIIKEEVSLLHPDSTRLEGILEIPDTNIAIPLVVFIAGSGPTDRDCNSSGLKSNAFVMLGKSLNDAGFATLRYDKRTAGKSKMPENFDFSQQEFHVLTEDLLLFLKKVKDDKRFSEKILLGHSQGSLVALLAAQQMQVDALVSVAGAGRSIDKIIYDQMKDQGLSEEYLVQLEKACATAKQGEKPGNYPPVLASFFSDANFKFVSTWMQVEPTEEIKKLDIPILIVNGTTDFQVPVAEAEALLAAKPESEKLIIEGMNHVLKDAPKDRFKNMMTYRYPDLPLSEGLAEGILLFLKKL